ncbi:MAG: regulatory protein GemA [Kastovskya adunca ATA6-11-RM4]|jgi:phage gp16-like protein|nr:regulatory protein GemA [Kastovskya adunca ATA6-11-RM4]
MESESLPAEERKRLLAKIHVAKKQLKLSEEAYRAFLQGVVGASSCKDLDISGLNAVLNAFKAKGFKTRLSPASSHKPRKDQTDKIRALWIELHNAGKTEDGSEPALNVWIKRMTGIERLEWTNKKQRIVLIESLKKWLER